MRFHLVAVLVLISAATVAFAGEEVAGTVVLSDRTEIEDVARHVSIDRLDGLVATVIGSPEQLEQLEAAGYPVLQLPPEEGLTMADMCPAGWVDDPDRPWSCYPTYPQYVALMQRWASEHPDLCVLYSLGTTTNQVRPHELLAVKISDNPLLEEAEPEVLYTSSMHGDETTGYVLLLRLIDDLLTGYAGGGDLEALVDGLEIWVNPLANPDGTFATSDTTISSPSRSYRTASGDNSWVDPNRNFPDPKGGDHPDGHPWWRETEHWMAFAGSHSIALSANFHGGIEVVNYPWDTWQRRHADDAWLVAVSRAYADRAQAASGYNGYMTALNNGITNGWDWYSVEGGRQDYFTYFHGAREVTIEVSDTKTLPASGLDAHWTWNREALLHYLGQAFEGIHGVVVDDAGAPVDAVIEILGHDSADDNSFVRTDPEVGDYHRMLLPGSYTVHISAYGYEPVEVTGVTVGAGAPAVVDATLVRLPGMATVQGQVVGGAASVPIPEAIVEPVGAPVPAALTDGSGTYVIPMLMSGAVTFRITADGYEPIEVQRDVTAPATTLNFALAPLLQHAFLDLEQDDGGLVATGQWQHGAPTGVGNPGAHSGVNVWATNLAGSYPADDSSTLDLPAVTVPSGGGLAFWHFVDIEQGSSDWDGGNVSVRPAGGGTFTVVHPDAGYPSDDVSALGEPGFTGTTGSWSPVHFDLSDWADQQVDIRWHFASDGSVQELGWYLDDIGILGAAEPEAVFEIVPQVPAPGEPASFVDRSTGAVAGWSWSFGDGATSNLQNPVHAYAASGTYTVTLTASWPDGTRASSRQVTVGEPLFADGFESGDTAAWSDTVPGDPEP